MDSLGIIFVRKTLVLGCNCKENFTYLLVIWVDTFLSALRFHHDVEAESCRSCEVWNTEADAFCRPSVSYICYQVRQRFCHVVGRACCDIEG